MSNSSLGTPNRILVVGAGLAGLRTAAELRAAGFTGHLRVIGAEPHLPYDRPPLSKELLSHPEPTWLADDLDQDLSALADDLHLSTTADALHVGTTTDDPVIVQTTSGDFEADAVVAATGSRAVQPADWSGTFTLHSLEDAADLRARLVPGASLIVIGAGWIGAEVAGVAAGAGCDVTVLEAGPAPLARQLGTELGARTIDWYAAQGVRLRTDTPVASVRSAVVTLATGEVLTADVVLCAIGARPSTGWLEPSMPLTASGHLPVDGTGRSMHPRVWAVGDVAARTHPLFGSVPGGHWSAALTDPVPLARALVGHAPAEDTAEPAPYVYSTQLGHHLTVFGRLTDDQLTRGDLTQAWTTLCFDGEHLVGAVIADAPREVGAVRKLLSRGSLPRLDRTLAADPATPLRRAVI
ncbi:NAD(P)/FAD-dependent oxidoreductase [Ruania alba]|uniref:NADPH-dependent 2,4-dienoyl-CoA reductase, sulfur reductase n=1 Tax=Ruania alba TaxID=648782 RepID=A0A1H5CIT8_9MICO|nr:FAD-dependent oxidoreductase [Ruania alba]SED66653.1 NADPH-dependent 2,4-dienoyl-CoA reductase, sulfur reductase [Ruania alba]